MAVTRSMKNGTTQIPELINGKIDNTDYTASLIDLYLHTEETVCGRTDI